MQIRILTQEDAASLPGFWAGCPGMGINDVDDSPEGLRRYLKRNPQTCFGAFEDGRLAGTILAGHDGRRGHLYHLAVAEAFQGQGIGRALTEHAVEALRKEGVAKVMLVVLKSNPEGGRFWEHMGFAAREDLVYRDLVLTEMHEIFT